MFEILMIIGLILIFVAIIVMINLNKSIRELIKQNDKDNKTSLKKIKRTHSTVSKAKFDNVLSGRTNVYDKFKNKDGLYEPVKTKAGIEIRPRKEE